MSKKRKLQIIGSVFLIIGIICLLIPIGNFLSDKKNQAIKNDNGYTIENYKIKLNVKENNQVEVLEEIETNFIAQDRHGIYKFIPRCSEYTGKDGKKIVRKSNILNLKALDENYQLEYTNGKDKIIIGKKDNVVLGPHIYKISYTYDMGNDPFKGFDEFIFHAFGDFWTTPIKNASIELTMPDKVNISKLKIFEDKNRQKEITNNIYMYANENTIYMSVENNSNLTKSLTIDYELEEGYFKNTTSTYGAKSFILCLIIIILAIISFIVWKRKGKKEKNANEDTSFDLLEKFDAAQLGYLQNGLGGKKLTIAIILELASKNYIKIEKQKNNDIWIKKLEINPKEQLTENEKIVLEQLFENKTETNLKEEKSFYKVFQKINKNLEIELDDIINDIPAYKQSIGTSFFFMVSSVIWVLAFSEIKDLQPNWNLLYFISFIGIIFIFFFSISQKRKSTYGKKIQIEIEKLKSYIETAEKEELERLTKEKKNYISSILPYAFVLGVSKTWIQKLDKKSAGLSDSDYISYIDDISNSIDTNSSSGGCSSCGGGCSSCGGGGSW